MKALKNNGFVLSGLLFMSGLANAETVACFYSDVNYSGASYCVSDSVPDDERTVLPRHMNDAISSVKVWPGFKVTLHQHDNTPGGSIEIIGNTPTLVGKFNDVASSYVKVTDPNLNGWGACLYADPNYTGDYMCIKEGFAMTSSGDIITFPKDPNYTSTQNFVVFYDYGNNRPDKIFGYMNDRTTSVKINPEKDIKLSKDSNITGQMIYLNESTPDFRYSDHPDFNDQITAVVVREPQ